MTRAHHAVEARHYHISIEGIARAKGRPRFSHGHAYTPESTRTWEEFVAWTFQAKHGSPRLTGPVKVTAYFHQRVADLDNLCKAILDGLEGVAYEDDRQVVELQARKEWTERNEHWTDVTVEAL